MYLVVSYGIDQKRLTSSKIGQKTLFRYQNTPEKLLKLVKNYQKPLTPSIMYLVISYGIGQKRITSSKIGQKTLFRYQNTPEKLLKVVKNYQKPLTPSIMYLVVSYGIDQKRLQWRSQGGGALGNCPITQKLLPKDFLKCY